jgi:hypothetical protein
MILKTRLQSQRDSRWGSILLGNNTSQPYTIYNYGCLITSLANYIDKQPDEVNQMLKDNSGFIDGGLFVWSKCTTLGLNQTYLSARCSAIPLYTTEVTKLRESLKQGYPALCEVDFNPATDAEEMHFVLAVGYTDTEIIVVDPWEGQLETWTDEAFKRNTYQYRIYDKKLSEGISNSLQDELNKCIDNRNSHWDFIIKIAEKLGIETNETLIMAEIDKLVGYEDKVIKYEAQLNEVNAKAIQLEVQLAEKAKLLKDEGEQIATLTVEVGESQKKIKNLTDDYTTALASIQELKTQCGTAPKLTGLKKFIYDILLKI